MWPLLLPLIFVFAYEKKHDHRGREHLGYAPITAFPIETADTVVKTAASKTTPRHGGKDGVGASPAIPTAALWPEESMGVECGSKERPWRILLGSCS